MRILDRSPDFKEASVKQRLTLVVMVCCMASQILVSAQRPLAAREAFDVASIKPSGPAAGGGRSGGNIGGCSDGPREIRNNRLVASRTTLYSLIALAYFKGSCLVLAKSNLLIGGPQWTGSEKFDVQALTPEGFPAYTLEQLQNGRAPRLQMMIQSLLADRFKLKMHREIRKVPVYLLTVAKGGPKLKQFKEGSCINLDVNNPLLTPPREPVCRTGIGITRNGTWSLKMNGGTFEDLCLRLGIALDHTVVDKTGRTGLFDATMEFAVDEHTPLPGGGELGGRNDGAPDPTAPSIFTVIQQQLGLKLVPTKGPVEVLIIDHAERPTSN